MIKIHLWVRLLFKYGIWIRGIRLRERKKEWPNGEEGEKEGGRREGGKEGG